MVLWAENAEYIADRFYEEMDNKAEFSRRHDVGIRENKYIEAT